MNAVAVLLVLQSGAIGFMLVWIWQTNRRIDRPKQDDGLWSLAAKAATVNVVESLKERQLNFGYRQVNEYAKDIADEAARANVESLCAELCGPSGHPSPPIYFTNKLASSESPELDLPDLQRIRKAVIYLKLRSSQKDGTLPFVFHQLGDRCWFEDLKGTAFERPAPTPVDAGIRHVSMPKCDPSEDDFRSVQPGPPPDPMEIERQAVKRLYDMGYRWTGREWLDPSKPTE